MTEETVLVLRCCAPDGKSYQGFQWPSSGPVEAPDWDPTPECGNGLHGWLWGEGDASASRYHEVFDALWIVVEVDASHIVQLDGKIKFRRGNVVRSGTRDEVIPWLQERAPGRAVICGTITVGDRRRANAGDYGTASAGQGGTASAGKFGTVTAGFRGTATAGQGGTATAGDYGTASAGDYGTASAGDYGTAIASYRGSARAGDYGTAIVGDSGTARAGDYGTAIVGDSGTASAGYRGSATAGKNGIIHVEWFMGRRRLTIGYVGEDGIEPNVPYRCDENGKLVRAS